MQDMHITHYAYAQDPSGDVRRHRSHHWKYVVLEKKVAVVNTDIQAAHNIDQYIQNNHKSYAHILAYAVDLWMHDAAAAVPLSIVLITVNISNINQSCGWRQNALIAQ